MADDQVTEQVADSSAEPVTYSEVFEKLFPFYLSIGMSRDEYWHGPARLVCDYYDAYIMRRDEQNYFLWLNGAYMFAAISTAISNVSLDGKRHKPNEYLKEPFQIRPKTEEEKVENVVYCLDDEEESLEYERYTDDGKNTEESIDGYLKAIIAGPKETRHKRLLTEKVTVQGCEVEGGNVTIDFSKEYHVFTVDWEPGLITWYVDGHKFHETNDWFTKYAGGEEKPYPAPFNVDLLQQQYAA